MAAWTPVISTAVRRGLRSVTSPPFSSAIVAVTWTLSDLSLAGSNERVRWGLFASNMWFLASAVCSLGTELECDIERLGWLTHLIGLHRVEKPRSVHLRQLESGTGPWLPVVRRPLVRSERQSHGIHEITTRHRSVSHGPRFDRNTACLVGQAIKNSL